MKVFLMIKIQIRPAAPHAPQTDALMQDFDVETLLKAMSPGDVFSMTIEERAF